MNGYIIDLLEFIEIVLMLIILHIINLDIISKNF